MYPRATMLQNIHDAIVLLRDLLLLAGIVLGFAARRWSKVARYQRAVDNAIRLTGVFVADAERTVRDLKDHDKPGDWSNPQERERVRRAVIERVRSALGPGLHELSDGLRDGLTVDEMIARMVEAQVERMKIAKSDHAAPESHTPEP